MSAALTDAGPVPARTTWLLIGLVSAAGLFVRAIPLALSDFPVNDGGLFMAMTQAIQDAGWSLPATVAWNGTDLPFTYPPLAFYKVGLLNSLLGLDLFDVFRWYPLLASVLIVPAVYLLARELLRSDLGGLVAALAYALAPASYVWLIQGGGVTRSPGLLLAVLATWQTVQLVRHPTRRRAVVVGVLAGLTALVHPGAAVFAAFSGALLWLFEGRTRASLFHAAGAVGVALVLVAPWALLVISRHGLHAMTDVPSNGPDLAAALLAVIAGRYTGLTFTDPLAVIGLALALLSVIRRQLLLPLWFVAGIILSYQYAMIPFGLLVGGFAVDLAALWRSSPAAGRTGAGRWIPAIGVAVLAACLLVEGASSALTALNPGAPVHALSSERRHAMAWVADNVEPEALIAVITDSEWSGDPDSEWFPLLTGRISVATVQGAEWLGVSALTARVGANRALQACVRPASVSCVRDWLMEHPADYVYLPKGPLHGPNSPNDCCADLLAGLLQDRSYALIYNGAGATILMMDRSLAAEAR